MKVRLGIIAGVILLAMGANEAQAQDETWQNQWYWGAQGGAYMFDRGGTQTVGGSGGAHWFITAARSALYFAWDKTFFSAGTSSISTGQTATFSKGQRLQALVYVIPTNAFIQPMLGGGFAINRITDASLLGLGTALDSLAVKSAATKASFVFSAGLQIRMGPQMAFFGQYQYMPASEDFMISSEQHAMVFGVRYAFTGAKEAISTTP